MQATSFIRKYIDELSTIYDKPEAESITRIVMEDAAGIESISSPAIVNLQMRDENIPLLNDILSRLMKHEPLQYILGEQIFYRLKFKVNPDVLIPRRETEELVEWIIKEHKNEKPLSILDIGTGSGCIAIALKKNIPDANVFATDFSIEALDVAKENAKAMDTEIHFALSDILTGENPFKQTFDIIVSNPPYITEAEKKTMMKNVTEYEPHTALFVPGDNPLIFYNAILKFAAVNMTNEGTVYFEVNESYGSEIIEMLGENGFQQTTLKKDMQGKDRMVRGILTPLWL